MSTIFGIDLGTTLSGIAYIDANEQFHLIPNAEGQRFTPSAVYFEANGAITVGRKAAQAALLVPERVVLSAKRRMGSTDWLWEFGGQFYRPSDIAALVLAQLREDAIKWTGGPVRDVVLTVPAHFNDLQRSATIEAAELANLHVVRLLNEPTAAALAFGHQQIPDEGWIMVVDLGGGTLDVTLLESIAGQLHTRATNGHAMLGGEDWDALLLHHAAAHFVSEYGIDPLDDPMAYQQLREQCIAAKHTLTIEPKTSLLLAYAGHQLHYTIEESTFRQLSHSLLGQMEDLCGLVLADQKMRWQDLSRLLLVGGASVMPMVQERLGRFVKQPAMTIFRADEAVLYGAAIQAAALQQPDGPDIVAIQPKHGPKYVEGQVQATDINTHSLGLVILDRDRVPRVDVIIPRYSPLPHQHKETYFTAHDRQTSVKLQIVEGESLVVDECVLLGEAEISGLPPRAAGQRIELEFVYDESGHLTISLLDVGAGQHNRLTFQRTGARSMRELETMKRLLLAQHPNPRAFEKPT